MGEVLNESLEARVYIQRFDCRLFGRCTSLCAVDLFASTVILDGSAHRRFDGM